MHGVDSQIDKYPNPEITYTEDISYQIWFHKDGKIQFTFYTEDSFNVFLIDISESGIDPDILDETDLIVDEGSSLEFDARLSGTDHPFFHHIVGGSDIYTGDVTVCFDYRGVTIKAKEI